MTLTSLALVGGIGLAGALGAVARYLLGRLITERIRTSIPLLQDPQTDREKVSHTQQPLLAPSRWLKNEYKLAKQNTSSVFVRGTLLINLSGAFLIGLIFSLSTHKLLSPSLQALLATGFLGGYTTFSTLNWETLQLAREGATIRSILYLGGTYMLGLLFVALGLSIGGWLS